MRRLRGARSYQTDYVAQTPADSFLLTLGCGKYRIRDRDHGTHPGLPRLLDMGQCNVAYGAILVAGALAQAFGARAPRPSSRRGATAGLASSMP
ncbi:hypothetical protein WMF04_40090 [Sorangium sp. So ce260]